MFSVIYLFAKYVYSYIYDTVIKQLLLLAVMCHFFSLYKVQIIKCIVWCVLFVDLYYELEDSKKLITCIIFS